MNTQMERPKGHTIHQQDPPPLNDSEKKSVLKKVKAKAKKIKDTITGHADDHHHRDQDDHGHEDDPIRTDPQFHGAPGKQGGEKDTPKTRTGSLTGPEEQPYAPKNTAVAAHSTGIADTAAKAKDTVATKLGYGKSHEDKPDQPENEGEAEPQGLAGGSIGEYGKKVAATVQEKLAPVYEKLKPGGEDRALSEVITEAVSLQKSKDDRDEPSKGGGDVKGRVTQSEEVRKRLGPFEETSEDDVGTGLGKDTVLWLKETAESWFGKGTETQPSLQGSSLDTSRGNESSYINNKKEAQQMRGEVAGEPGLL